MSRARSEAKPKITWSEFHNLLDELERTSRKLMELRAEAARQFEKVAGLKARLSQYEVFGIDEQNPRGLGLGLVKRGSVQDAILDILTSQSQGLQLSEINEKLDLKALGARHPRTTSLILDRLKKRNLVKLTGRKWQLVERYVSTNEKPGN